MLQPRVMLQGRLRQAALVAGLMLCAHSEVLPSPVVGKAFNASKSGDFAAAERFFREALQEQPKSIELWNGLGVALNRQAKYTEAASAFRTALQIDPAIKGIQLNLGIALFRAGKFADAAREFEALQDQAQARELLAMTYVALERYADALPMLEQLAVSSTDPAIHIALATCYSRLDRKADVDKAMAHMFQVVPDSAPLHVALAEAYERQSDPEYAITEFRKAAQLDPALQGPHLQAGRLLWKAFRFDEAEPELQAELKIDPGGSDAKYYLGTIYLYRDDAARAIPLLESFVQSHAGEKNGYFELGRALLKANELPRAIQALEKAVALGPKDANLHYILAQAYRAAARDADAKKEFDASKRLRTEELDKEDNQFQNGSNKK